MESDWGIGHLATPVSGFDSMPIQEAPPDGYPMSTMIAGYARDPVRFPVPGSPPPGGNYCQWFGPNCWWIPATVLPQCRALSDADYEVNLDPASCPIIGGNSGSPVIWNAGTQASPWYRVTGVVHGGTYAADAARYLNAPREAAGVALASCDDGSACTQVFASDQDAGQVVSRYRAGTSVDDPFTPFAPVNSLPNVPSPGRMSAYKLTNGHPGILVVGGDGNLYGSYVNDAIAWQNWTKMDHPQADFVDVDTAYDFDGAPQLFVTTDDGWLHTRQKANATDPYAAWGSWQTLGSSATVAYRRVTAILHGDKREQVFVAGSDGAVYTAYQFNAAENSGWTALAAFGAPAGGPSIKDIDAAWTEANLVEVFAVDANGATWTRTALTNSPLNGWGAWTKWNVPMYAPETNVPRFILDFQTLTASRWQEATTGDIVPVVLATDSMGNVYYTTHSKSGGWTMWQSFYQ